MDAAATRVTDSWALRAPTERGWGEPPGRASANVAGSMGLDPGPRIVWRPYRPPMSLMERADDVALWLIVAVAAFVAYALAATTR